MSETNTTSVETTPATPAASNGKAPRKAKAKAKAAKNTGVTGREVKVLTALSKAMPDGLTRPQLVKKTGINRGWSRLLGASTKKGFGSAGKTSMEGRGLIRHEKHEDSRAMIYVITATGRKAIK